jgi:glutamate-1-semialdehyde 2,1-aminomutase
MSLSERLFERAAHRIPGGVNSPVRAWGAVGGHPAFVQRARGCQLWDVDGNVYIDYLGSWGPMILGHAHPAVLTALRDAMSNGTSFGAPTAGEVDLAESLCTAIPSMDMVRLVNSGTEATMTAIRLARGFTGRARILKFAGCYHGHVDALLVRAGSGAATFGVPDSAGIPEATISQTLVLPHNDLDRVRELFAAEGDSIAAVIVEPVVGNMGLVPPAPGFLEGLREVTAAAGALLIFDEVITGFRLCYGGYQNLIGVQPDLTCLGKIIGGGLPLAAFGGRRDIMEYLAPLGPVYQAGTLSGNPLAVAAGRAILRELARPGVYERLEELGARLEAGMRAALGDFPHATTLHRVGSLFTLFFGLESVPDAGAAGGCDRELYGRWFRGMLEEGIYLAPSQFECGFVSFAHGEAEIDATIAAGRRVLGRIG